jgi:heme/copper-type cytochrome/quinol oxidase subunit 2
MNRLSKLGLTLAVFAGFLLWASVLLACPTCKDNMAHDPASANLVRGYAYSILFMLSMPPLIFSSLSLYFYWEVRKARQREAAKTAHTDIVVQSQ